MLIVPRMVRSHLALVAATSLVVLSAAQPMSAAAAQTMTASQRCQAMTTPIYESQSPHSGATLLTTWPSEASRAASTYGFVNRRGTPFRVTRRELPGLVAVHRMYNPRSLDFLWTKSVSEVRSAVAKYGYRDEGVDFYASMSGGACLRPVYRYEKGAIHRYAANSAEQVRLSRSGWKYESIAFYAGKTAAKDANVTKKTAAIEKATGTKRTSGTKKSSAMRKTAAPKQKIGSVSTGAGPLSQPLYLNKSTAAWNAYASEGKPDKKQLLYQIAATPTAIWLGGRSTDEARVRSIMKLAKAAHRTPTFVLYAIPHRDCGSYSAGGLKTVGQYKTWVASVKRAIAGRKSVVIIEPDAIAMPCLSNSQKADRYTMLKYALTTLSSSNVWVYIHAGSNGLNPRSVAAVLKRAGISKARGFAVNVSSFDTTANEIAYGKSVLKTLGMNKHFVIDTSRNGLGRYTGSTGSAPGWCNPPGRALGSRPTTKTASAAVDAYLWIKPPGESDGSCRAGDPSAGGWYVSYALDLVQRSLGHKTVVRLHAS